jgi:hypothetical protein
LEAAYWGRRPAACYFAASSHAENQPKTVHFLPISPALGGLMVCKATVESWGASRGFKLWQGAGGVWNPSILGDNTILLKEGDGPRWPPAELDLLGGFGCIK